MSVLEQMSSPDCHCTVQSHSCAATDAQPSSLEF